MSQGYFGTVNKVNAALLDYVETRRGNLLREIIKISFEGLVSPKFIQDLPDLTVRYGGPFYISARDIGKTK